MSSVQVFLQYHIFHEVLLMSETASINAPKPFLLQFSISQNALI